MCLIQDDYRIALQQNVTLEKISKSCEEQDYDLCLTQLILEDKSPCTYQDNQSTVVHCTTAVTIGIMERLLEKHGRGLIEFQNQTAYMKINPQ